MDDTQSPEAYRALWVLVPSRPAKDNPLGRPRNLARLVEAIGVTASHPERIHVVVRLDDDAPIGISEYASHRLGVDSRGVPVDFIVGPRIGLARSWAELVDRAAACAPEDPSHVALWGDDVVPETLGWDVALTGALRATNDIGFSYCRDGVWDHTLGHTIPDHLDLPSAVITTPRTMALTGGIPEGIRHLFTDNWWRDLGWGAGVLHYVSEHMIRHRHPISHTARSMWDDTYRQTNSDEAKAFGAAAYQEWAASEAADQAISRLRRAAGLQTFD